MEQILSQQNIAEKIELNFQNQVVFFPVRHHSPVCSYHLRKTIEAYQPEIILIEGPENANDLISVLTDEKTVLPCAIYYFYKDKKKYISEDAEDYHCYYPFLNASPEFTAMKEAKKLNIPAKFMDLPYSEILINSRKHQQNYADDSLSRADSIRNSARKPISGILKNSGRNILKSPVCAFLRKISSGRCIHIVS